jgi:hypothetical protein
VDELRIACAVPPSHTDRMGTDESSHMKAELWAKKLDTYDMGSKPLIQCALRALQATGRMIKRSRDLEHVAVGLLANQLSTLFKDSNQPLDKSVGSAISAGYSSSVSSQFAGYVLQQDFAASSELRSFLVASTSLKASHTIFGSVSNPLNRLKTSSGSLLIDLCVSMPDKGLSNLHSEEVWLVDVEGDDNLLPQSCFTQVRLIK